MGYDKQSVEDHEAGKKGSNCADSVITFSKEALSKNDFRNLDENGKQTTATLTETFAGDLNASQKNLFKNSIMDAMESKVGSLSRLARPENADAAGKFAEMMNSAGFDVRLSQSSENGKTTHSMTIFEQNSKEGMRFNAVSSSNGKGSEVCLTPDPVERSHGKISSTNDLGSVIRTQDALADRVKNFLDRE